MKLIFTIIAVTVLFFSSCEDRPEKIKNQKLKPESSTTAANSGEIKKSNTRKEISNISFNESDIKNFIKHFKEISNIGKRYDSKLKNLKIKSGREKIIKEREKMIKQYLLKKKVKAELYMKKSEKIMRVFIARKLDTEIIGSQIDEINRRESDPEKRKILIKSLKSITANMHKQYMEKVTADEKKLIDNYSDELEKVIKSAKLQNSSETPPTTLN